MSPPSGRIAAALTGKRSAGAWTVATPSRIADFATCPRRYFDSAVLALRGEPLVDERASTGSAVHEALSVAHSAASRCQAGHIAERIASGNADEVLADGLEAGVDPSGVAEFVLAHSRLCPTDLEFIGAETDLFWWDSPARILYRGRTDALWSGGGELEIRDYKTGRRAEGDLAQRIDIATYAVLGAVNFPNLRPITVTIEYLAEGKIDTVRVDEELFGRLLSLLRSAGQTLAEADEFATRPGPQCTRCPFQSTCPESEQQ